MFAKNLRYYRLKRSLSKKRLASLIGVTPMAISNYESGKRQPDMATVKALAGALGVKVADFLSDRNTRLVFEHGEFRKGSGLAQGRQEYIREEVEEYLSRFYTTLEILGGEVLPEAATPRALALTLNPEEDARSLRGYLGIAASGPVGKLVERLENIGILVYACDLDDDAFSGMNGLVNGRPYVVFNKNMTPERIRSTLAHELAHFAFVWPEGMGEKESEKMATAISGAFLFPAEDAKRELGLRRTVISRDMAFVCREYGISMYLLVKRAVLCGIITAGAATDFYIRAGQAGWKRNEPVRAEKEEPFLFELLVFRAVSEGEISVQKGAELLRKPYTFVAEHCFAQEG